LTLRIPGSVLLFPALAAACAGPDPCEAFCDAIASRTAECLREEGSAWSATAWADEEDLRGSCATWAWEWRLLEADAGQGGATDAYCADREAALAPAPCAEVLAFDWEAEPWPP
jgi:hypothetical protein